MLHQFFYICIHLKWNPYASIVVHISLSEYALIITLSGLILGSAKDTCKGNNISTIAPKSIAQHTTISSFRLSSMFAKVHTYSSSETLQGAIHFCITEIDNNHTLLYR